MTSSITSKAVVIPRFGGPGVLTTGHVECPAPARSEVRVRVEAAAVAPTDLLLRRGLQRRYFGDLPLVPGMEFAGQVESIGSGVDSVSVGDRVMSIVSPWRQLGRSYGSSEYRNFGLGGAQAEHVVVPSASVVALPDGWTAAEASTLPMTALTAVLAVDRLKADLGEWILVTGAAGGVGGFASKRLLHAVTKLPQSLAPRTAISYESSERTSSWTATDCRTPRSTW
jgi:NADPH2:quinone reductase